MKKQFCSAQGCFHEAYMFGLCLGHLKALEKDFTLSDLDAYARVSLFVDTLSVADPNEVYEIKQSEVK